MCYWKKIMVMFLTLFLVFGMCGCQKESEAEETVQVTDNDEEKASIQQPGVYITYKVVCEDIPDATDMDDTISKLRKRAEKYSGNAVVYQSGADGIVVEIPGVDDANAILQELGRRGELYFISETAEDGTVNYSYVPVETEDGRTEINYSLNRTLEELLEDGSVKLTGDDIFQAEVATYVDQATGTQITVEFEMTEEGSKKFETATSYAYERGETLGIYFDGEFISVPTVSSVITDGVAIIHGLQDYEEAERVASCIRSGALKYELKIINVDVIGSSNKKDSKGNEVRNEEE